MSIDGEAAEEDVLDCDRGVWEFRSPVFERR
jgi:hypothetical protein